MSSLPGDLPGSLTEGQSRRASGVPELGGARRGTRSSVASQVTFADLFGSFNEDDAVEDASSEQQADEDDSSTLIRTSPRKSAFPLMEKIFFLYLLASSFSRVNLKQVYRIEQCLSVLKLNLSQCQELFKLEDVRADDIRKASDLLVDARLGVEYAAGTILALLLSQYLVKYGLKHALLFCLIGSWFAHSAIYITIYFVNADVSYTFLAAIPLIISGGEILMSTIAFTNIGTTSMGNARRWRFVAYEFCVVYPEAVVRLLDAYIVPNMGYVSLELGAIALLSLAILLSLRFSDTSIEGFESHSLKQRFKCSMGPVSVRETIMCFSKKRPCRGRFQLAIIICILSTSPFYFDLFSSLQAAYMSKNFSWDTAKFLRVSSMAFAITFVVGLHIYLVLTRYVRPLDPTVAVVGFSSLIAYYVCLLLAKYSLILYYGGLIFLSMPIFGMAALRSHVCQIIEKSDMAPVFALICALTRLSHVMANRLWEFLLSVDHSLYQLVCAENLLVMLIAFLCVLLTIITRSHGYPSTLYYPAIGGV